jgi:hypothetical protein
LTIVTQGNIFGYSSLHSIPPISPLEIMIHLSTSWVNGIGRVMSFTQY